MTRIHFQTMLAGAAMLALSTGAAAQSENLRTTIEVQQLVASNDASAQAALRDHFAALADRYAADAKRHEAMARVLTPNPVRSAGVPPGAHCARLAQTASKSAATVRELAAHYGRLAAGLASVAPARAGRFLSGEGAPEPDDAKLRALGAGATTPADHHVLREYFVGLAERWSARAREHEAMATAFRGGRRSGDTAAMCDRAITRARESAADARNAAELHRQLANVG